MNSLNILVIDDEQVTQKMLQRLLERDGHFVVVASNGLEGIDIFKSALAQQKPFDIVITDYGMPQMNGMQVAKLIKTLSPSTPVIMLSGWDSASSIDSGIDALVDFLLNKPVTNREIRAAIKEAVMKRRSTRTAS
ncbi:MAG: response regulator [Armatimonadetes bacterium]|nr:response regulator [Armatimonadota bacterium]